MINGAAEDEYISAAAAGDILGVSPRQAMRYGATVASAGGWHGSRR